MLRAIKLCFFMDKSLHVYLPGCLLCIASFVMSRAWCRSSSRPCWVCFPKAINELSAWRPCPQLCLMASTWLRPWEVGLGVNLMPTGPERACGCSTPPMVMAGDAMVSCALGLCRPIHGGHLPYHSWSPLKVARNDSNEYHHFYSHCRCFETDVCSVAFH